MCGNATTTEADGFSISIDDWLEFEPSDRNLYDFRLKLDAVVNKRIENPHSKPTLQEEIIINALYEMLSAEDAVINLRQPQGFGKKPKLTRERENLSGHGYYGSRSGGMSNGSSNQQQSFVRTRQVRNENVARGRNGMNRDAVDYRASATDRFLSPNVEFYLAVAEKMEDLEVAFRRRQWFLSPEFARAAQAFNVST